jgi:hypothetical protein
MNFENADSAQESYRPKKRAASFDGKDKVAEQSKNKSSELKVPEIKNKRTKTLLMGGGGSQNYRTKSNSKFLRESIDITKKN